MIAIFDLDGTLSLNEHRQHFLAQKPKDWDSFYELCDKDFLNIPIASVWERFAEDLRFILTGRTEEITKNDKVINIKDKTIRWLKDNGLEWYDGLYMRQKNDFRDDVIIKSELFKKLKEDLPKKHNTTLSQHSVIVFDDRQKVVDMWRKIGLVCCQVATRNF